MSGHSKWANIKNKKEKGDAAKAKIFTKIGREIAVAVKAGGADIENNARLRDIISKAKSNNMPNDNITRSIKKASGDLGNVNYEELMYEGYGIGGVAVLVEVLTDNKNRTAGDVRHFFDKYGGSLGSNGCVSFLFDKKGVIIVEKGEFSEDEIMEIILEAGAEDMAESDEIYEIYTQPGDLSAVKEEIEKKCTVLSAETDWIPQNTVSLDRAQQERFEKMIEIMEDCDDIQEIYHNAILD